jgi:hypothetical protein
MNLHQIKPDTSGLTVLREGRACPGCRLVPDLGAAHELADAHECLRRYLAFDPDRFAVYYCECAHCRNLDRHVRHYFVTTRFGRAICPGCAEGNHPDLP